MPCKLVKPNFIVIGAARSGTTSLFQYLERHPDIFMSEVKELNFFSNDKYWNLGLDWYYRHFDDAKEKCVGEASTSYTSHPYSQHAPKRIFSNLPDVKLIYVVRDPIDRFVSHYLHRVTRGVESRELTDIVESHPDDFLLLQGKYDLQISRYLEHFPADRIHCLTIDSLQRDPVGTVGRIYDYLNVPRETAGNQDFRPRNVNKRITRKSAFGRSVLRFYHENIEQRSVYYAVKRLFLQLGEIGAGVVDKPQLDEDTLSALIEYYRVDVQNFSRRVGIDTSTWRDYSTG